MFCDNLVNYYSDDFNYILAKEYEKYIEKSVFLEIFFKSWPLLVILLYFYRPITFVIITFASKISILHAQYTFSETYAVSRRYIP